MGWLRDYGASWRTAFITQRSSSIAMRSRRSRRNAKSTSRQIPQCLCDVHVQIILRSARVPFKMTSNGSVAASADLIRKQERPISTNAHCTKVIRRILRDMKNIRSHGKPLSRCQSRHDFRDNARPRERMAMLSKRRDGIMGRIEEDPCGPQSFSSYHGSGSIVV